VPPGVPRSSPTHLLPGGRSRPVLALKGWWLVISGDAGGVALALVRDAAGAVLGPCVLPSRHHQAASGLRTTIRFREINCSIGLASAEKKRAPTGLVVRRATDGLASCQDPRRPSGHVLRPSDGLGSSDISRCSRGGRSSTRVPRRPRLPHRRRLEIARPPRRTFSRRCSPRSRDSPVPM
jgi:hypothetical protein